MKQSKEHIPVGSKCPRCGGSGREKRFGNMSCGGCNGTGITQAELCPNCLHPVGNHVKYPNMGIVVCQAESTSGAFLCGCQMSDKHAKPVCNVCGEDFGNTYCLEDHLSKSERCRENFKLQFYGDQS